MATRGRGLFSLYIYIEKFRNVLVRNQWTDFSITCRNVSLVTLYQDCSSCHDLSKNMAARGWGGEGAAGRGGGVAGGAGHIFPIYLYRKL